MTFNVECSLWSALGLVEYDIHCLVLVIVIELKPIGNFFSWTIDFRRWFNFYNYNYEFDIHFSPTTEQPLVIAGTHLFSTLKQFLQLFVKPIFILLCIQITPHHMLGALWNLHNLFMTPSMLAGCIVVAVVGCGISWTNQICFHFHTNTTHVYEQTWAIRTCFFWRSTFSIEAKSALCSE